MKKVKLFIVTYNSKNELNTTIRSCLTGDINSINFEINVINNHSNFSLDSDLNREIKVYHNKLRPDFSTGHLSRSWNQAIINGFKDLNNPDCDILITCQDDVSWKSDWVSSLLNIHEKYDFYTCNHGDALCSYNVEAIKKIGLWDERFCNIQFQEADYFLRANLYNSEKSSINDSFHGRTLNQTLCIADRLNGSGWTPRGTISNKYHDISYNIFYQKWGDNVRWNGKITSIQHCKIPSFFYYPYFEKDIYGAKEKGYMIP